jgi:hypothetical protein
MNIRFQITIGFFITLALITLSFTAYRSGIDATHIETAAMEQEQFESLFNYANKIDNDLGLLLAIPDNDPQFKQFSKSQRVLALRNRLNTIIAEYNTKSSTLRTLWKSKDLPLKLDPTQFKNL